SSAGRRTGDGGMGEGGVGGRKRFDPFFNERGLRSGWRAVLWLLVAVLLNALFVAALKPFAAGGETAGFAAMALAATLAGWLLLAMQGRRIGALGWALDPAAAGQSALSFAAGGVLILLAVAVLAVAGSVRWVAAPGTMAEYAASLARMLAFYTVAAAAEEALFRGYGFQALAEGTGPWIATAVMSLFFALAHGDNPDFGGVALANIFLAGVLLSLLYLRTRSLWTVTALHLGWNWTMSALHFPVSGLAEAMPAFAVVPRGPAWWTGAGFGPEAGLPATLVLLLGIAWTVRTRRLGESPRMRELAPLVDARLGPEWPR
ncbi:MAG TPA: CPBP family intramembrane glutamic endopeptidase, partial [Longimicrobiaceae bacterium]|nr:CPBP family intramembrane glutamic endopeptidase [Longimicrobiaceae bacterium]